MAFYEQLYDGPGWLVVILFVATALVGLYFETRS